MLPVGSSDGLAAAIAAAGPKGRVIVQAGVHSESGITLITAPVNIVGEPGAVIETGIPANGDAPLLLRATLHFRGAGKSLVRGITFRPAGMDFGNTAILLENSSRTDVSGCTFRNYQGSVRIQNSDFCTISGNTMSGGAEVGGHGVVVINGNRNKIIGNRVSGLVFGEWLCGSAGEARGNEAYGCLLGIILCNVPSDSYDIGGQSVGSLVPGTRWQVVGNNCHDNDAWGYLVIDKANNNMLVNNNAARNGLYDIELTGDTYRFGFLTPSSYENMVVVGQYQNLIVKDCGRSNRVVGATLVDNTLDPCN